MKKTILESDQDRKEKEFIKFAKLLKQKDLEYKRLIKSMPDPDKSDKSTVKQWYIDFISLLFK